MSTAKTTNSRRCTHLRLAAASLACSYAFFCASVMASNVLPTGGTTTTPGTTIACSAGTCNVTGSTALYMLVTQTASKSVVNWLTFNIGTLNTVTFAQPS